MSTSAALAGSAAASAAVASDNASRAAQLARCSVTMPQYDPRTATVAQMQEYASCVQAVHPSGDIPVGAIKFGIVLILAGLVAGAIHGKKGNGMGDLEDVFMWSMFGAVVGMIAALVAAGVAFLVLA